VPRGAVRGARCANRAQNRSHTCIYAGFEAPRWSFLCKKARALYAVGAKLRKTRGKAFFFEKRSKKLLQI
jgi:hypothetical protein